MYKKSILIINKSFELGGIQASLMNMLEALHDQYDISLAVFNPRGPFLERLPHGIKLINVHPIVQTLGMTKEDCRKNGTIGQKIFKLLGGSWSKLFGNRIPISFALAFQKKIEGFDYVISYHQEQGKKTLVSGFGRFVLEKCISPNKIAWVHADFTATGLGTKQNYEIYNKFNIIVSVSKATRDSFNRTFPELKNKSTYCYNYLPEDHIKVKSLEKNNVFEKNVNDKIIVSVGRLTEEKGILSALNKLMWLFKANKNLKWYIIGEGPQYFEILKCIDDNDLSDNIFVLGFKSNPYPYIREADLLFVPSRHETFGMVVGEAHILGTRVCASDIPVMKEVLFESDYVWDGTPEGFPSLFAEHSQKTVLYLNNIERFRTSFSNVINGRGEYEEL